MTGQHCTGLLAALLLAGPAPEADGFQDTPEDPPSGGAVERDPALTKEWTDPTLTREEFSKKFANVEAEWFALVNAEQAKVDRYQARNFLGDLVQLGFITYVVNEIAFLDAIVSRQDALTQQAREGYVFCVVDITLDNVSESSRLANLGRCHLVNEAGDRYYPAQEAILALKTGTSWKRRMTFHWRGQMLQPGLPVHAQLVFRLPEASKHEALSLDIATQKARVLVELENRSEDDPPRVERPAPPTWRVSIWPEKYPRPAEIELGLNDWLFLTRSVHVIKSIEFQEKLDDTGSRAPEQGIYLRIDSMIENPTDETQRCRGTSSFDVVTEDGRRYDPVRVEAPIDVPPRGSVAKRSFFLLPRSCVDARLDLLVSQPASNLTEPRPDTYGWINLKP